VTVLATFGGVLGLVLAYAGLGSWRAWGPADFPQMATTVIDGRVLAFAAMLSSLRAMACAVAPAWFATREAKSSRLTSDRTTTVSRAHRAMQRAFVSAQMISATVLLVGMLLMAHGLARLEQVAPGFTPGQALSLQLSLPPATYKDREALTSFFEALRDRLRSVPGTESVGAVSLLPLSGLLSTADVALLDRPAPPPEEVPQAHLRVTAGEYFQAAGIQVLEGRSFDDRDGQDGQPVAIVSRTFAERHWPGASAIGKSLEIVQTSASPRLEIVGVVSDVKQFTLDAPATADLYVPLHQMPAFQVPLMAARTYWVVRGRDGDTPPTQAIRAAVTQVDPTVAASSVRTLESVWLASLGSRRANVRVLQAFAYVALGLCTLGVYGVTAFAARARRRELAIRSALGGSRLELTMAMLRREIPPLIVGVGAGVLVALIAAPGLFGSAFEVNPRDAATYAEVAAILLSVGGLATYIPVRRASAANPADVLTA